MNHESKSILHQQTVAVTDAPLLRMSSGKMLSPNSVEIFYARDMFENGSFRHSCWGRVSGLQMKKDGEVGVASGSRGFYGSKMSDWPDWIRELVEAYEPWDRL